MRNDLIQSWLLILLASVFWVKSSGQTIPLSIEEQMLKYGETWLKVPLNKRSDIEKLSSFTSVAGISDDSALVNVSRPEFIRLVNEGFLFAHMPLARPADEELMKPAGKAAGSWDYYPTWQQYDSIMYSFGQNYPALCKTYNFLTLSSGRKLLILKLTSPLSAAGGKPVFLYSSTIHGNETAGYILMLRLADHLLSGYSIDPESTWLLDNMEIWICPLANPDGTYYGGNHTVSGAIRRNANLIDMNRNYPDPREGPNPDGNPYQPETVAFMGLSDTVPFVMGANLHSGAEVVNYPWDTWYKQHPDDQWWIDISRRYADTTQAASPSGFFTYQNNGITNGAAWYVITGGRQDYMNYFAACRELTIEVSEVFIQPANQLQAMWDYHHRSLINFLKEGWFGIRGIVKDSVSGLTLKAKVWVNQHDADSSHVWSSSASGNYFRPIHQGNYNITWSAPGYHSKTQTVTILPDDTVVADIELVPVGFGISDNRKAEKMTVWYNNDQHAILFDFDPPYGTEVSLYSADGRMMDKVINPDRNTPLSQNRGIYLLIVTAPGYERYTDKIVVY